MSKQNDRTDELTHAPFPPTHCPRCKVSFQGEPIPEASRKHYGGKTHFSRLIGVSDRAQDRTVRWVCPDCFYSWERS